VVRDDAGFQYPDVVIHVILLLFCRCSSKDNLARFCFCLPPPTLV
jgi:hypothetical protein